MYSSIIQISSKPISANEYFTADDYDWEHWFVKRIADHVDDVDEGYWVYALEWLKNWDGIEIDTENRTLIIKSKETFFLCSYEQFKSSLMELERVTLKKFSGLEGKYALEQHMFRLNGSYKDKFGFYIEYCGDCGEDSGLMPLAEWVRDYAKENETYYIGAILDYHY